MVNCLFTFCDIIKKKNGGYYMKCKKCGGFMMEVKYDEEVLKDYFSDEYICYAEAFLKCENCDEESYEFFSYPASV